MAHTKMTREESLARAHAASRRKRLDRWAQELREYGYAVLPPEENPHNQDNQQPKAA